MVRLQLIEKNTIGNGLSKKSTHFWKNEKFNLAKQTRSTTSSIKQAFSKFRSTPSPKHIVRRLLIRKKTKTNGCHKKIQQTFGNTKNSISQNRREAQQLALSKLLVTFGCPLSQQHIVGRQLIRKQNIANRRLEKSNERK